MECTKIIPLLTEPQLHGGDPAHAFHVVCPSIPGTTTTAAAAVTATVLWDRNAVHLYSNSFDKHRVFISMYNVLTYVCSLVAAGYGYSSHPSQTAFDQQACAEVFHTLMTEELEYSQYFLQGGDWGSVVTSFMAALPGATQHVLGLHLNMVPALPPVQKGFVSLFKLIVSVFMPWGFYTPLEREGLLQTPYNMFIETGYFHEQSTRPLTLAYGLSDSPVGLLAWIVEKFYQWSDCKGDLYSRFTRDELLTNFMIYWTTNSAGMNVTAGGNDLLDTY